MASIELISSSDSVTTYATTSLQDDTPSTPSTSKRGRQMIGEACDVPCCQLCKNEVGAKWDGQCGSGCDDSVPFCSCSRGDMIKTLAYLVIFGIGAVFLPLFLFFSFFWDSGSCSCSDDNRYQAKCCEKTCG